MEGEGGHPWTIHGWSQLLSAKYKATVSIHGWQRIVYGIIGHIWRLHISTCQSVSTCKTWDCSLKVLSGQLSSPIPDCSFPSFGQSMIVGVKKCKKHQKRARRTSGQASDRMGREKRDKIAGPGLNNMDDRNETPIVAHQSSQESYKRPTLSHPKMIPTLTPTLKILLHQTCYPVSP